jgi:hypothetical protein
MKLEGLESVWTCQGPVALLNEPARRELHRLDSLDHLPPTQHAGLPACESRRRLDDTRSSADHFHVD